MLPSAAWAAQAPLLHASSDRALACPASPFQGPKVAWHAGRVDAPDPSAVTPNGRLPDADKGSPFATAKGLRSVFNRMGFDDREIVALSGAHGLGRCESRRAAASAAACNQRRARGAHRTWGARASGALALARKATRPVPLDPPCPGATLRRAAMWALGRARPSRGAATRERARAWRTRSPLSTLPCRALHGTCRVLPSTEPSPPSPN